MKKLLSPKNDYVFKKIMGDQHNIDILAGFLKSLLDIPHDEYEHITVEDPHLNPDIRDGKKGILDVRIKTKSGKTVNVEIQLADTKELPARILFYASHMLTEQLSTGDNYCEIKKVISIVILDYDLIENAAYHNRFRLYDMDTGHLFSDLLEIHTLELKKLPQQTDSSALYNWLSFLKAERREDFEMIAGRDPDIKKAYAVLAELSQDEKERRRAESYEKARRDEESRMRISREEGREAGLAIGAEKKALEAARNALKKQFPLADISDITGLSLERIEKLKSEMHSDGN